MKSERRLMFLLMLISILILVTGCKKEETDSLKRVEGQVP